MEKLQHSFEEKQQEVVHVTQQVETKTEYVLELERKLQDAEGTRRALHNAIQELKGNIRVFARVRPAPEDADLAIEFLAKGDDGRNKLALSVGEKEPLPFAFDKIFDPSAGQEAMFAEVDGLVQSALDGFKVCIFAYGQTGSGKTYTMQGTREPQGWGLIPRSLRKLLESAEAMRAQGWEWDLSASFLEIYNEQIRDLLREAEGSRTPGKVVKAPDHKIQHDKAWGSTVTNMPSEPVTSMEQVAALMTRAAKMRAVGSTDMNATSSRSHSVFALYLSGTNSKLNAQLHGALHLVDLAGSERLDRSGATGEAAKETMAINKSLSTLSRVFVSKATGAAHVPFKDSKLTHLMEPCLSGQGKTLMVVNVGPEADNAQETLCSLRFGEKLASVRTSAATAAPVDVGAQRAKVGAELEAARAKLAGLERDGQGNRINPSAPPSEQATLRANLATLAEREADVRELKASLVEAKASGGAADAIAAKLQAAQAAHTNLHDLVEMQKTVKYRDSSALFTPATPAHRRAEAQVAALAAEMAILGGA